PGHNGKTVFLNLIRGLLGEWNCASVTLQAFGEQRFAPAQLFGKLANIAGDLDARAIKRTDMFKMATGNDTVMAEHKYGQPFNFVPFAVPLFSANEAPISADQTDAWFDRWLIVPFERRFTGPKDDPKLTEKLTTPEELSGLLAHSVGALGRLMDRGRFEVPESVRAAGDVYRSKLDTVRAFVEEECEFDRDGTSNRTYLYKDYSDWCKDGGRWPVSNSNFFDHLRRNWPGLIEEGKSHGARVIRGLRKRGRGE
ncbi:MAG: phage/plasmid primase, P4 family, partial [Actinobacteria bacterium]|nr:phage/plasmid primase, P4 family [Actinomycetota bacterium]